jgi:hypothetical protein
MVLVPNEKVKEQFQGVSQSDRAISSIFYSTALHKRIFVLSLTQCFSILKDLRSIPRFAAPAIGAEILLPALCKRLERKARPGAQKIISTPFLSVFHNTLKSNYHKGKSNPFLIPFFLVSLPEF